MECDAGLRYQNKAVLVLDSRDRTIKEEANKFSIKLNKPYKDVISIELKKAQLPNSDYVINEFNNLFYFQDSEEMENKGDFHQIQLPIGDYSADHDTNDSLRSLLEQGLNASNPGNTYSVEVDGSTHQFTITQESGSGTFNILFIYPKCGNKKDCLPNNMAEVLGFSKCNQTGDTSYTGSGVFNLRPNNYIILRIKGWERVDSNRDSVQNSFCILPLDTRLNNFMLSNNCDQLDNEVYQKDFNPPMGTLDRVNLEILNANGQPYNFRGRNFVLVFEITSLSRYSNYHTKSKIPRHTRL